jgi:hypothetical protein
MSDLSKIIHGKKFMWDGVVYESEKEAKDVAEKYKNDNFEVEMVEEENHYLIYSRRVVKEIVLEGPPPA